MESHRSKGPETGKEEGTSSNARMDQDDVDKLALDEGFTKAALVRKGADKQLVDGLHQGLTTGKRNRKGKSWKKNLEED